MKKIRTQDAVGQVLCHDMTQIIKGVTKDARFRKGHIVTEEDIPVLLSMGRITSISGRSRQGCSTKTTVRASCAACAKMIT